MKLPTAHSLIMDWVADGCRKHIASEGGLGPVAFVIPDDPADVKIMPLNFSDDSAKEQSMTGLKVAAVGAAAIIIAAEAWYITRSTRDGLKNSLPPSEAPDRKEGVFITYESSTQSICTMMPIIRNGAKVSLGPAETSPADGGRLTGILQRR